MIRALALSSFALMGVAFAGDPLTADEVDRFINVAETLHEFDEENGSIDIDIDVDDDDVIGALDTLVDRDGDIVLVDAIADELMDNPETREVFRDALRANDFRDEDEFADVGNRLLTALIRAEISDDELRDLQNLANGGKDLPAGLGETLRRLDKALDRLDEVSDSDIRLAREAEERLDDLG